MFQERGKLIRDLKLLKSNLRQQSLTLWRTRSVTSCCLRKTRKIKFHWLLESASRNYFCQFCTLPMCWRFLFVCFCARVEGSRFDRNGRDIFWQRDQRTKKIPFRRTVALEWCFFSTPLPLNVGFKCIPSYKIRIFHLPKFHSFSTSSPLKNAFNSIAMFPKQNQKNLRSSSVLSVNGTSEVIFVIGFPLAMFVISSLLGMSG